MQAIVRSAQGVGAWNEDALVCDERRGLYGVIDGATSFAPYRGPGGETGGYLAAQGIAAACRDDASAGKPLPEMLLQANARLREAMDAAGIAPHVPEELWSACAAFVRIGPSWIEFAQLGDCMLAVYYADGTIRIVTHDQLAHVDDRSKAVWFEGIAAGLTAPADLREHTMGQLIAGRALANRPGGYGVLNGDPACADYLEFGRISSSNAAALLLFSDGLYIPKPPGVSDKDSAAEIAALVRDMGLDRYLEWLTDLENTDPDCTLYPRMKKSDDKTAIWIELT
ncbi:protein phosphatase 2C domain-containing protein [Paenibacillus rhizovicinus]|uniref:Protein phosphatase 2C domain-containing protein n=1 Tax=Paenibacillus rhizovicinus TaxID=2704463 RepID=A0A6C0P3H2_9BACL|nr:protein phosphatase 2C domain-containing protein [Paenibacillus rhizovicinus]QHW32995.1 protein phosphatase 2C domain-containing protein [Paenibacillus rhizovicinus]